MKRRPKTGEKRKVRQPFKLDRLPLSFREWIESGRRERGLTWAELEDLSHEELKWDTEQAALKLFPDRRLPATTMQRWHDVKVDQVIAEAQREGIWAREVAGAFARNGFEGLPDAVKNALGEQIFVLMRAASDKDKKLLRAELLSLMDQLTKLKRVAVQEQKIDLEKKRLEIEVERMKRSGGKIAKELDGAAASGKPVDLKALAAKVREVYGA